MKAETHTRGTRRFLSLKTYDNVQLAERTRSPLGSRRSASATQIRKVLRSRSNGPLLPQLPKETNPCDGNVAPETGLIY